MPRTVAATAGGLGQGAGFDLSEATRTDLLERLARTVEDVTTHLGEQPVSRPVTPETVRAELARYDLETPRDAEAVFNTAVDLLTRYAVHVPHPRYFGLFNPAPTFMGVLADALVAAFNPAARGVQPRAGRGRDRAAPRAVPRRPLRA